MVHVLLVIESENLIVVYTNIMFFVVSATPYIHTYIACYNCGIIS